MDISIGGIFLFVWKIGMGEDKNQNRIRTLLHNFHVFLHPNIPLKLVVIWQVRAIIVNWLAGGKNFDITDATAPTPAQIFGAIISKRGWDDDIDAVVHFFT